jgi:hypothetical protein
MTAKLVMLETDYQKEFQDNLAMIGWPSQSHRDMHSRYIPDVSFSGNGTCGWVEVKYQNKISSLGKIKHYTKGQEEWLIDHGRIGTGNCFLLVGTPAGHSLFRWDALHKIRNIPYDAAVREFAEIRSTTLRNLCGAMWERVR